MTRFRIFGLAGAAVLALALNGCGSSDERSDEPAAPPAAPMPTAVEMAASVLSMAKDTLADAMQSRMDVATGAPYDDWLAAQNAVLDAQNAVVTAAQAYLAALEADTATAFGDVDAARQDVADARTGVAATQMQIANNPRPVPPTPPPPSGEIAGYRADADHRTARGALGGTHGRRDDEGASHGRRGPCGLPGASGSVVRPTPATDGCVVGITVVRDRRRQHHRRFRYLDARGSHGGVHRSAREHEPRECRECRGNHETTLLLQRLVLCQIRIRIPKMSTKPLPARCFRLIHTFGNLHDGGMLDGCPRTCMGSRRSGRTDMVSVISACSIPTKQSTP